MRISKRKLKKIIKEEYEDLIDDFESGNKEGGKAPWLDKPDTEKTDQPLEKLNKRDLEHEQHEDLRTILVNIREKMKPDLADRFPSRQEVLDHMEQLATQYAPVRYAEDISSMYFYPPKRVYDKDFLQKFMGKLTREYPGTEFTPVWMFDYQR